ncbi:MAG: hypothetical protein ACK5SX_15115 [Sandaracinobacter sp.]
MIAYREHFAEHLRLTILRFLGESPGYQMNTAILKDLASDAGLPVTRDMLETQAAWLAEQGFVTCEQLPMQVTVVTLTQRGSDVADGRAIVPGVRRPSPRG